MSNNNSRFDVAGLRPPILMVGGIVTTAFSPWLSAAGSGARRQDAANSIERIGTRMGTAWVDKCVNKDRS
ncbi:hypothetical protein [Azospirillum sp. TSO22-1]|uniref:hypothetical protein n=1 Tax=Azospirillum sp. TSO22-1 TaxID=716789 RepID=UPI0011B5E804|nr:hypothetical protein [Azospirillum sp. TSO22-1]